MKAGSPSRYRPSYRTLLASVTGGIVLVLGGALGLVQYTQNALAVRRATSIELTQTLRRVDARVQQLLVAAELTAGTGLRQTTGRSFTVAQLPRLFEQVVGAFEQRPELTYLGYAIASTGEYGLLERRPDGAILFRLYAGPVGADRVVTDYRWAQGTLTKIGERRGDTYDARNRPHFIAAQRAGRGTWTDIYPFVRRFASDVSGGLTFAVPSNGPDGTLTGVWDASLDLQSLSDFMRQLVVETGATPFLYTQRGTSLALIADQSRVAASVGAPVDSTLRTTAASDNAGALLAAAARAARRDGSDVPADEAESVTDAAGQMRYIASMAMADSQLPGWAVAVTVPRVRVDAPLRALGQRLLLITLAILLAVILLSRIVARRLAQPLEELGRAADAIASGAPVPADSGISSARELSSLRTAFQRMSESIAARESALRITNQRLQSHVENTPLGVVEWDARFHIVSWNPSAAAIFGWSAEEMIGGDGYRFVPPEEREMVYNTCAGIIKSGKPGRYYVPHITRSGSRIECEWYLTPTTDSEGRVTGVTALVLDVSQRLHAEEAYREAEERFEQLFRAAPAGIGITRVSDDRLIDVNDAAMEIFGFEREAVIGKNGLDLAIWVSPVERAMVLEPLKHGNPVREQPARLRASDGRELTVLFSAIPITLGGETCSLWVCIDVTEQAKTTAQLLASRSLKAAIIDATRVALVSCDDESRIIDWNDAATMLLGWPRADVIGRRLDEYVRVSDERGDVTLDLCPARPDTPVQLPRELQVQRRDGAMADVDVTVIPVVDGERNTYAVALRDISARRQLARERDQQQVELERRVADRTRDLAASNESLQHADAVKNRFLATVSHELRTPLTAILGYSDMLRAQHDGVLNASQSRSADQVHAAASDLLRLINDLLDLSRVEGGRLLLKREPVQLGNVLTAVEGMLAPEAARKGLTYRTTLAADLADVPLTSDALRLQQVLLNLAGNAVKFTAAGSVDVRAVRADDGGVTISVTDTGPGIPASQVDDMFEPFTSFDPNASAVAPGAGLGLYLVRRLLELLGGRVTVSSTLGAGSCFTVWLPLASPVTAEGDVPLAGAVITQ
jgi:PAS domain S-box-containing protein